ncbi:MAG: hormogonium polysaccharide biosynthesis glycosyltransferase HpsE [Geitlerinemataceae cyanobacterium]
MLDICIAIRTYNGEKHLAEILDALQAQSDVEDLSWEVLVVDNCSTDSTADIVRRYQASWQSDSELRYYFEPTPGADIARRSAVEQARAPWIGFLDDDNTPALGWVRAAVDFAKAHPKAGAFGSQIHGKFEAEPPRNFKRIAGFLPVIERSHSICFTEGLYDRKNVMPPGAGLVILRQAWMDCVPPKLILKGPVRGSLTLKGEDIEILTYIKQQGWEIWYNANMHIYHHIPPERFDRDYLIRFFQGVGLSRYYTRTLGRPKWHKPAIVSAYLLNDLRKAAMFWMTNRDRIAGDAVIAGEFELYRSSIMSPIDHIRRKYLSVDMQR